MADSNARADGTAYPGVVAATVRDYELSYALAPPYKYGLCCGGLFHTNSYAGPPCYCPPGSRPRPASSPLCQTQCMKQGHSSDYCARQCCTPLPGRQLPGCELPPSLGQ